MIPILGLFILNLLMLWGLQRDLFWRQTLFWSIGLVLFLIAKTIRAKRFFALGGKIYFLTFLFLLLPLILGQVSRGSSRWIWLGIFSIQPSELVKPILIGVFSWWLTKNKIKNFNHLLINLVLISVPVFLVLIQPDLGSAGLILATLTFLAFISQPNLKWWIPIIIFFGLLGVFSWNKVLRPYQVDRIKSFISPESDPLGKGYNTIQSQIAIGSGGFLGRGFGQGKQTQLRFLPEKQTDFIFSAIGEELGLLGIIFTLAFYFWLFYWMGKIAFTTKDEFGSLFKIGILVQILTQTIINIAMNLQLFPVVGIPLPLLSYGGSSLISILFSLGLFLT